MRRSVGPSVRRSGDLGLELDFTLKLSLSLDLGFGVKLSFDLDLGLTGLWVAACWWRFDLNGKLWILSGCNVENENG